MIVTSPSAESIHRAWAQDALVKRKLAQFRALVRLISGSCFSAAEDFFDYSPKSFILIFFFGTGTVCRM